jgi:hypothetical protein
MKRYRNTEYFVDQDGNIFRNGRKLKYFISNKGYYRVGLFINKKQTKYSVHRVVAEVYVPNPDNLPEVNHEDLNKLNNHYTNLKWSTSSDNIKHSIRFGKKFHRGIEHPNSKLTEEQVMEIRKTYIKGSSNFNQRTLAEKYNVTRKCISKIIEYKTWNHL